MSATDPVYCPVHGEGWSTIAAASYAEGDGGTLAEWHGSSRAWPIHILQGQVTVPGFCLSVMRSPRQPYRVKPIS